MPPPWKLPPPPAPPEWRRLGARCQARREWRREWWRLLLPLLPDVADAVGFALVDPEFVLAGPGFVFVGPAVVVVVVVVPGGPLPGPPWLPPDPLPGAQAHATPPPLASAKTVVATASLLL